VSQLTLPAAQIDFAEAWASILNLLKSQLSAPSYQTWIAPLNAVTYQDKTLHLSTSSIFTRDWVLKHYTETVQTACAAVMNLNDLPQLTITITAEIAALPVEGDSVNETRPSVSPSKDQGFSARPWKAQGVHLNPKYTFEHYVVGSQNRFCHAAATAICEAPGQCYNPLFLYGGVGLGKTHLMQAIGHSVQNLWPDKLVKYVTAEQFTNDLIGALGSQSMKAFREKYRQIDVLLIDDIQFLEGKERTQEEVFHTFNALHQAGKQVVIASDRPIEKLSRLEDRLRSRFGWGLIADMQAPDFETRVAILQKKSDAMALDLSTEICHDIAETFPHNIRELEGALNKLNAYKMITGHAVTREQAESLLAKRFDPKRLSCEDMLEVVAHYYHLKTSDLKSPLRAKHVSHARQVAVYIVRELTEASFPKIGVLLGNRKHTTILYSYEKLKEQLPLDTTLARQVKEMMDQIRSKTAY
jgi:chromosomal replication initiator protein